MEKWLEVAKVVLALTGLVGVPWLAKRNARWARVAAVLIDAIEQGGHGPTKAAAEAKSIEVGVQDHLDDLVQDRTPKSLPTIRGGGA